MLKVFYGREDVDHAAHLYHRLEEGGIVVVPEQYTLQAEREALAYLDKPGLLGTEILSFSSLGRNILQEAGGIGRPVIDRYGRHMLLAGILKELEKELILYKKYTENTDFISMVNDMISQMKQYDVTPEALSLAAGQVEEGRGFLQEKLRELALIFARYEEKIQGRYVDTEDRIGLYCEKLADCASLKGRRVSVLGFDYFTPNNRKLLGALTAHCREVNVYLAYSDRRGDEDLFALGSLMMASLRDLAKENGSAFEAAAIGKEWTLGDKAKALVFLEDQLFRMPAGTCDDHEGIRLVKAANYYTEAAACAAEIRRLTAEEGYSYSDITLICNDLTQRGSVYKRIFADYDLPLFLDQKRDILHHPAVAYVTHLLDCLVKGYRSEDLMAMLKSGMTDLEAGDVSRLELYGESFRIRGSRWKQPFTKGVEDLGAQALAETEALRQQVMTPLLAFAETFKNARTMEGKATALYNYLAEQVRMPERLSALIEEQWDGGDKDLAAETAQIWNSLLAVLDQMVTISGDAPISNVGFRDMLTAGVGAVELGLLPPDTDTLIMGTAERTRSHRSRAVFVLGANQGTLPLAGESREMLTEDEKEYLESQSVTLCKMDRLRAMEETLAIYRDLTKADERLWVSFAASDEEGNKLEPSSLVETVKELYPGLPESGQQEEEGGEAFLELLGGKANSLNRLGQMMKAAGMAKGPLPKEAAAVRDWYREHDPRALAELEEALSYRNEISPLGRDIAKELYIKEDRPLQVSPSRLEMFGRCPFRHFVRYGLHPEQPWDYEVQSTDMGSIYHDMLRTFAARLTEPGKDVTAADSLWMTITEEERAAMVDEILDELFASYREGLLESDNQENYRARRIRRVSHLTTRMVVEQVRAGHIEAMGFEVPFGHDRILPPLRFETRDGDEIQVYGTIDRVDRLAGDGVKVIDYKSGRDTYDEAEAKAGWKLQLFLYLDAAENPTRPEELRGEKRRRPIGTFYFHVDDPLVSEDDISDSKISAAGSLEGALEAQIRKEFVMNGVMVRDEGALAQIAGEDPEKSDVLAVRGMKTVVTPEGETQQRQSLKSLTLLEEEEFQQLLSEVNDRVREMAGDMLAGSADIAPRKSGKQTACEYCDYRHICKFDLALPENRYTNI